MEQEEIHTAINDTLSELIEVVSEFDQQEFNIARSEDKWTVGQIVQHLVLSISGFVKLMTGPTQETTRNPEANVEIIKSIFLNFSKKLKSPEFIVPEKKNYDKEDLLRMLNELKTELNNIIQTSDLEKTCTLFELPTIGNLTRKEALAFVVYHTQRHIHQLRALA